MIEFKGLDFSIFAHKHAEFELDSGSAGGCGSRAVVGDGRAHVGGWIGGG